MLKVDHLGKTYGEGDDAVEAIGDLDFEVHEKEFVCVVGPSGCGKTTLLKCMSGLLAPSQRRGAPARRAHRRPAREDGARLPGVQPLAVPLDDRAPERGLPAARKKPPRTRPTKQVEQAVESVDLTGFLDRYPWELSGGMQQRVAIARALAYQPEILLMDEPFASVDAQTRADLEDLILEVRREYGVTVVFVTHDIDESVYLGDRVVVLTPSPTRGAGDAGRRPAAPARPAGDQGAARVRAAARRTSTARSSAARRRRARPAEPAATEA